MSWKAPRFNEDAPVMWEHCQARDWIEIDIRENRTIVGEHCQVKRTSYEFHFLVGYFNNILKDVRVNKYILRTSLHNKVDSIEMQTSNFSLKPFP